jgi:hypothetical protein
MPAGRPRKNSNNPEERLPRAGKKATRQVVSVATIHTAFYTLMTKLSLPIGTGVGQYSLSNDPNSGGWAVVKTVAVNPRQWQFVYGENRMKSRELLMVFDGAASFLQEAENVRKAKEVNIEGS